MTNFKNMDANTFDISGTTWACDTLIEFLEELRQHYISTKDEQYLMELMRLLPNTYRVRKGNTQYEFREVKHHFIL